MAESLWSSVERSFVRSGISLRLNNSDNGLAVRTDAAHLRSVQTYPTADYLHYEVAYISLMVLFLAGELDRRDRSLRIPRFNFEIPNFWIGSHSVHHLACSISN